MCTIRRPEASTASCLLDARLLNVFLNEKRCKGIEKSQNSGLVQRKKCKARKTLKNDALDAKIGVDTAVNEPLKV